MTHTSRDCTAQCMHEPYLQKSRPTRRQTSPILDWGLRIPASAPHTLCSVFSAGIIGSSSALIDHKPAVNQRNASHFHLQFFCLPLIGGKQCGVLFWMLTHFRGMGQHTPHDVSEVRKYQAWWGCCDTCSTVTVQAPRGGCVWHQLCTVACCKLDGRKSDLVCLEGPPGQFAKHRKPRSSTRSLYMGPRTPAAELTILQHQECSSPACLPGQLL